jgi:hypothetical protein
MTGNGEKPGAEHAKLIRRVFDGSHNTWWWRLLVEARFWWFLVPWPLGRLLDGPKPKRTAQFRDNSYLTATLFFWVLYLFGKGPDGALFDGGAKALFSGALALMGVLSLSIALPGQTLLKRVVVGAPRAAITFVAPFVWALLWGLLGATLLTFWSHLPGWLAPVVVLVALHGAFMELNALFHALRMYSMGLLLWGREEAIAAAEKRAQEEAERDGEEDESEEDEGEEETPPPEDATPDPPRPRLPVAPAKLAEAGDDGTAEAEAEAEAEQETPPPEKARQH